MMAEASDRFETTNAVCIVTEEGLELLPRQRKGWQRVFGWLGSSGRVRFARSRILAVLPHPPQPRVSRGYFELHLSGPGAPHAYTIVVKGSDEEGGTYRHAENLLRLRGYLLDSCPGCGHRLLDSQRACPECGRDRRSSAAG